MLCQAKKGISESRNRARDITTTDTLYKQQRCIESGSTAALVFTFRVKSSSLPKYKAEVIPGSHIPHARIIEKIAQFALFVLSWRDDLKRKPWMGFPRSCKQEPLGGRRWGQNVTTLRARALLWRHRRQERGKSRG